MGEDKYDVIERVYNEMADYASVAVGCNYEGDEVGRRGDMRHTKLDLLEYITEENMRGVIGDDLAMQLHREVEHVTDGITKFRRNTDEEG